MSTWGSIYKMVRTCRYNADNAPVQLLRPKTQRSRGHYGLLIFTIFSVSNQLWLDMCPLMGQLRLEGALMARDLCHVLLSIQPNETFAIHQGYPVLQKERRCKLLCHWQRSDARGGAPLGIPSRAPLCIPNNHLRLLCLTLQSKLRRACFCLPLQSKWRCPSFRLVWNS
jgi:hypothetical protein